MAKQTGPVRITGTFNGVCYYIAEGVYLARKAYSHSKERIARDPAFKVVRQNNNEFKGAVRVAKVINDVLITALVSLGKPRFIGRLTGAIKRTSNLSRGIRGQRPIQFTMHKNMVEGFEFNPKVSFMKAARAMIIPKQDSNKRYFHVLMHDLVPSELKLAPPGATHFRMVQVAFILSDYVFTPKQEEYTPLSSGFNAASHLIYSDYVPLSKKDNFHFLRRVKLPDFSADQAQVSIVHCLGMEFFKQYGSDYLPLKQGNCMAVIKVW